MKKLLLLISAVAILASCSDDSSTNPNDENKLFLMTNVGSYWIYESTIYPDGLASYKYLDSLNLDSKSKIGAADIYNCAMHSDTNNNGSYEENVISNYDFILGGSKLCLTKESFIENFLSLYGSFDIKTELIWNDNFVKIADTKSDNWTIISQKALIELPDHRVKVDGDIKVNVSKIDSIKKFTINNIDYDAYGFKLILDISGQAEREGFTNPFFTATYGMETVFWVVDGIGPISIEKSKLKYSTTNTSASFPVINAKNSMLVRYYNSN